MYLHVNISRFFFLKIGLIFLSLTSLPVELSSPPALSAKNTSGPPRFLWSTCSPRSTGRKWRRYLCVYSWFTASTQQQDLSVWIKIKWSVLCSLLCQLAPGEGGLWGFGQADCNWHWWLFFGGVGGQRGRGRRRRTEEGRKPRLHWETGDLKIVLHSIVGFSASKSPESFK